MREFLVERVAVCGPSVLPEFFAVIGDDDDQRVVQNAELFQLRGQQL